MGETTDMLECMYPCEKSNTIPEEFFIGEAIGDGDCFFDSMAHVIQQIKPSEVISVTILRQLCKQFAQIALDTSEPSWFLNSLKIDDYNSPQNYINHIGLTASDIKLITPPQNVETAIWGRAEVEGRIICEGYDVKLHLIETTNVDGKEVWINQLVDKNGCTSTHCDYKDENIVHIINRGDLHFCPVLRLEKLQSNITGQTRCHQEILNAIRENDIEKLRELLPISENMSIDILASTKFSKPMDDFALLMHESKVFGPMSCEMHLFIKEVFRSRHLFACFLNLSREFTTMEATLKVICSSLESFQEYSKYFLMDRGISTPHVCLAFFMCLEKQYEQIKTSEFYNVNWEQFTEIDLHLTTILSPLIEYSKVMHSYNDARLGKMGWFSNREKMILHCKNVRQYNAKIEKIKKMFKNPSYGKFLSQMATKLKLAFTKVQQQYREHNSINDDIIVEKYTEQHVLMKDMYSLERIIVYINMALSVDLKIRDMPIIGDLHKGQLVVERALQVIGEFVNSMETAHQTQKENENQLQKPDKGVPRQCETKMVQLHLLKELINFLSESYIIKAFRENMCDTISHYPLSSVQIDLLKIKNVIQEVLQKMHQTQMKERLSLIAIENECPDLAETSCIVLVKNLLEQIKTSRSNKNLHRHFRKLRKVLNMHLHEEIEELEPTIREIVFFIKVKAISENIQVAQIAMKKPFQRPYQVSLSFEDHYEKLLASIGASEDSKTIIPSQCPVQDYPAPTIQLMDPDTLSRHYWLDVFTKELLDKIYGDNYSEFNKLKFGFDSDLITLYKEKEPAAKDLHLKLLNTLLFTSASKDSLNTALYNFIREAHLLDKLLKTMNIRGKCHENQFRSFSEDFRSKLLKTRYADNLLNSILQRTVDVAEKMHSTEVCKQLKLELQKKRNYHNALQELMKLCCSTTKVTETEFTSLVKVIQEDAPNDTLMQAYSDRMDCKKITDRIDDQYGAVIQEMSKKSYRTTIKTFQEFSKHLKIDMKCMDTLNDEFKKEINQYFEKDFEDIIEITRILLSSITLKKCDQDEDQRLDHNQTMTAIEMLVLKLINLLKDKSANEFTKLESLVHKSIEQKLNRNISLKCLRNYLSHGDALYDNLDANMDQLIIAAAETFLEKGQVFFIINELIISETKHQFSDKASYLANAVTNLPKKHEQIITESKYWKDSEYKAELFNAVFENLDKEHVNDVDEQLFSKILIQDLIVAVNTHDVTSTQFFLNHNIQKHDVKGSCSALMHISAERSHLYIVSLLVKRGFPVNGCDNMNNTPLHVAVMNQRIPCVEYLLRNNADVEARGNNGYTALHFAALTGSAELILLLINHGANVKAMSKRKTLPLNLTAFNGHDGATAELINHGALIGLPSECISALSCAVVEGHESIVQLLLAESQKLNERNLSEMHDVLHLAIKKGNVNIVKLLIKYGADVDAIDCEGLPLSNWLLERPQME